MTNAPDNGPSLPLIHLLKGVVYRDGSEAVWQQLLDQQHAIAEHAGVLGLKLVVDEAEGHAFLRQTQSEDDNDDGLPRLVVRRQLSYPVSLLLALLRKKMAEHDAGGQDPRLVLTREEIVDLIRLFLPDSANEAKLIDRVGMDINKLVELGFLRRMRGQDNTFEVRRILKAFVDAQWLAEFSERLDEYREHAAETGAKANG
jgi:hypothetical protein